MGEIAGLAPLDERLHAFANGLERDIAAVTAGLTLPWSSGAVEGHVNRIKMIKRQMYGRARTHAQVRDVPRTPAVPPARTGRRPAALDVLHHRYCRHLLIASVIGRLSLGMAPVALIPRRTATP
ncbi:hypothetical protein ACFQ9Z_37210 [Streptomyces sp. NPDC056580]|uniref:hypothetical protein n=1 Tax=Streptomyces sp. NPDC056580 TaxID=3345872 RepID=UPI00369C1648